MKRNLMLLSLVALTCLGAMAHPPKLSAKKPAAAASARRPAADRWKAFRFLVGNWSGDGSGPAGQGLGGMVVETDLDDSILRINNQVDFASKDKKTAYRGTMVVSSSHKALFLDNEGHVLHYTVRAVPRSITFLSDPEPSSPRFRFTYRDLGGNKVKCSFDIAPLDTPNKFTIHVTGVATKK